MKEVRNTKRKAEVMKFFETTQEAANNAVALGGFPIKAFELAKVFGIHQNNMRTRLDRLVSEGKLIRVKTSGYFEESTGRVMPRPVWGYDLPDASDRPAANI